MTGGLFKKILESFGIGAESRNPLGEVTAEAGRVNLKTKVEKLFQPSVVDMPRLRNFAYAEFAFLKSQGFVDYVDPDDKPEDLLSDTSFVFELQCPRLSRGITFMADLYANPEILVYDVKDDDVLQTFPKDIEFQDVPKPPQGRHTTTEKELARLRLYIDRFKLAAQNEYAGVLAGGPAFKKINLNG